MPGHKGRHRATRKKPFAAGAQPKGQSQLHDYFGQLDKNGHTRGRPRGGGETKTTKTTAPSSSSSSSSSLAVASSSSSSTSPAPKRRAKRTQWGAPENVEQLRKIVSDWDNRDNNPEIRHMSQNEYCKFVGIPKATLKKYICSDKSKRRTPGAKGGATTLLTSDEQELIVQCIIRRDRANVPYSRQEIVTMIMELRPDLTNRIQVGLLWDRVHARNKDRLTNRIKAQDTTTKRSAITVASHYRWHKLVDDVFNYLQKMNTPDGTGQSFESVKPHFIWNLDEECLMASAHGEKRVYCEKRRRKHENISQDSRCSITLLRLGNAAGYQGATIILCKGKKRKKGFTDAFLQKHGMTRGSTIIMTESALLTYAVSPPPMPASCPLCGCAPQEYWTRKTDLPRSLPTLHMRAGVGQVHADSVQVD